MSGGFAKKGGEVAASSGKVLSQNPKHPHAQAPAAPLNRTIDTERVPPSAALLIESMRDIGYSFSAALADVIDNSLTSGAQKIQLLVDSVPSTAKIGILDDGKGMTKKELLDAMRPGTRSPLEHRDATDLGRFGLGLKTASFSQCRRLTVVTRRDRVTSAAVWDLDYVAKKDDWLVQIPPDPAKIPWADQLGRHGTLVLWEVLDRVVDQDGTDQAQSQFVQAVNEASVHLEQVFHRFLAGESGLRAVSIELNNRALEPYDPFHAKHPATVMGPVEQIKLGQSSISVQCFTLPHHRKVSPSDWDRYGGSAGYVKNQGFYVYREKRLIIHGTWFGLARQMELTKLARVRIDIHNDVDAEWKIDVKKAWAQPPHKVRERLKQIIEPIVTTSKRIYTHRGRVRATDNRLPVWNRIQNKNEISYRINSEHPVVEGFLSRLSPKAKTEFNRVVEILGASLPVDAIFADLGEQPDQLSSSGISDEALAHVITRTVEKLLEGKIKPDEIRSMLKCAEPFRSNWERTEACLKETNCLQEPS